MKLLPRKEVMAQQLKISGVPLILAATYSVFGYFSADPEQRSVTTFINYFAAGFFF